MGYKAPLDEIEFTLANIVDLESISKLNGFQHADLGHGQWSARGSGTLLLRGDRAAQSDR